MRFGYLIRDTTSSSMDSRPVLHGEVPFHTAPNPIPLNPDHATDTESRTSKKRKPEQACDLCRKKKAKCQGGTLSCASCQDQRTECTFTNILRRPKGCQKNGPAQQHRKGSLDRMAERISRMETMLRQRGFLRDEQANNRKKLELKEADIEDIKEEVGRDSVPSLCGTGMDSTIQTGLTVTGSNMQPPPLPDKERVLGRVEMWLKGVPPFAKVGMEPGTGEEANIDNGYASREWM